MVLAQVTGVSEFFLRFTYRVVSYPESKFPSWLWPWRVDVEPEGPPQLAFRTGWQKCQLFLLAKWENVRQVGTCQMEMLCHVKILPKEHSPS